MNLKYILTIFILISPAYSFADEWNNKAIKKGNWSVAGSMAISYNEKEGLVWRANPSVEYFLVDNLSLGGQALFFHTRDYTKYGMGPSATYYFYEQQNYTLFIQQSFMYTNESYSMNGLQAESNEFLSTTTLGLNYFINENVALGPRISYDSSSVNGQNWSLLFGLQVYF